MLAATDGERGAVLLANPDAQEKQIMLSWTGLAGKATLHLTMPDCAQVEQQLEGERRVQFTLPAQSAVLVTIA